MLRLERGRVDSQDQEPGGYQSKRGQVDSRDQEPGGYQSKRGQVDSRGQTQEAIRRQVKDKPGR